MTKAAFAALAVMAMLSVPAWAQDGAPPKPGQTVDAKGNGAIDPTKNVLDLVLAAVKRIDDILELSLKRQDDLRTAQDALVKSQLKDLDEISALRFSSNQKAQEAENRRIDDELKLRAEYNDRLTIAEAKRIDAIRAVDVNAVTVASQRASDQASALQKKGDDSALVLSAQVTKSADDVRTLVKTTADEQSRNLGTQFAGIQTQMAALGTRLTALEQTGSESLGRQKYADPALAALVTEVQKLSRTQLDVASQGAGRSDVIGYIVAGLALLISLATAVFIAQSRPKSI